MPKLDAAKPYIRLDYTLEGKRMQRTAGRAENWEAAWAQAGDVDALIGSERGDPDSLTVSRLAAHWLAAMAPTWAPRYASDMTEAAAKIVLPALGSIRLSKLTRSETRSLVEAQGSPSGRKKVVDLLSSMLHFGVREGLVHREVRDMLPDSKELRVRKAAVQAEASDPDATCTVDELENFDDDHDERRLKPVTPGSAPRTQDALRLIRYLQEPRVYSSKHARKGMTVPAHYVLMFLVAAFCGLRQGEIWGMRGRDVEGSVLHVRMQLQWVKSIPLITAPKGSRSRDVYVEERVDDFPLRAMLAERARQVGPNGLMFPTSRGSYFRRSNFARDVMRPARAAAWPGKRWTFHGLRHHYCRWLLDRGYDIQDVAQLAGHSNAQVTWSMYISPNEGLMERAARIEAQQRIREAGRDPHES